VATVRAEGERQGEVGMGERRTPKAPHAVLPRLAPAISRTERADGARTVEVVGDLPAATWQAIETVLVPGARPDIARLVREAQDYVHAERLVEPTSLDRRERRRTGAAQVADAVANFLEASRILRSMRHDVLARLERKTTTAFCDDLAQFQRLWLGYLTRQRGRYECSPDCRSRATARPTSCARRCSRGSSISSRRSGVSEKARCSSG
jgi:hypothetical protein